MGKGSTSTLSVPPQNCVLFSDVPASRLSVISPEPIGITRPCTAVGDIKIMTKKKKVVKERWVCDICRIAAFDDFDEACRHEEICRKQTETAASGKKKASLVEPKRLEFEATEPETETDSSTTPQPETNKHVNKENHRDQMKAQDPPPVKKYNCKFEDCEICGIQEKVEPNENGNACESTRTANEPERRRSTRRKTMKSIKSTTTPGSSNEHENGASPKVPIAKTRKTRISKSKPSASASAPPAPIFVKKTPATKKIASKRASSLSSRKTSSTENDEKDKTSRTKALASIFQRKIEGKNGSGRSGSSTTSNALGKEEMAILAEHRAAELALKRRAKVAEEREKQRKRDEVRRINYEAKKRRKEGEEKAQTNNSLNNIQSKRRRKVINLLEEEKIPIRVDLTDAPRIVQKFPQTMKHTENLANDLKLLPPRFPNPSHIFAKQTNHINNEVPTSCWYDEFIRTSKYQSALDSAAQTEALANYKSGSSDQTGLPEDDGGLPTEQDLIYSSFSSLLRPCSPKPMDEEPTNETQKLWSDKYTIHTVPNDIHGDENKVAAEHLLKFINSWKEHRQQVYEARAEKAAKLRGTRKKKKRTKRDEYDDDLWIDDCDDEDLGICNVYLLTGPTGSGKTSLVHAAARTSQCALIEINTAMERGGRALKKAIEESTQSLSNVASLRRGNSLDSVGMILNEGDGEVDEASQPSLALILIDEVDLLFESDGDVGFWQSLASLTKKAKCPIILTSTSEPKQLYNSSSIRYEHSHLVLPTPSECASKMCQIARSEGMGWKKGIHANETKLGLAAIAKLCGCDLRRIMNEMHLFGLGQNESNITQTDKLPQLESEIQDTERVIKFPMINNISPQIFPSHRYSVISIHGHNFSSDGNVEVTIGDQKSPMTRCVSDNTILAVCPPCKIPSDVDSSGYRKDNLIESISTRYAPICISIKKGNRFVLQSDTIASTIDSSNGNTNNPIFVSYDFPDEDIPHPTARSEKDFIQLLDDAAADLQGCQTYTKDALEVSIVSPSPHSEDTVQEFELSELSKHLENISDACILNDYSSELCLPSLSGAILDFEPKPRDRALKMSGWYGDDAYKGGSDTFVTVPSRYERMLISDVCFNSRGKPSILYDSCTEIQVSEEDENDNGSKLEFLQPLNLLDEDMFLPQIPILCLSSLSSMLHRSGTCHSNYFQNISDIMRRRALSQRDFDKTMEVIPEVTGFILSEGRFAISPSSDYFWIDYVPHLRNIAHIELNAHKIFTEAMKAGIEDGDSGQRKRRRTRRSSPATRAHYLDSVLGVRHCGIEKSQGEVIGEQLAKSRLWYNLAHGG